LNREPEVAKSIPKKIARYLYRELDISSIKESGITYHIITASFLGSLLLGIDHIEVEMKDIAIETAKYSLERSLLSKYASQDISSIPATLIALSEAYKRKKPSRETISQILEYAHKLIGDSFSRHILSAEVARKLESGGLRELATEACRKVPKSVVCESLGVEKE